ncbi:MAG: helix-turn-helix domain-containing protein [Bacillota bacterium]
MVTIILNYKFEIYPSEEKSEILKKWINICRQTYSSVLLD